MSIGNYKDFDPRFSQGHAGGGFDDAHDVRRHADRDRIASDAAAEISVIQQNQRVLIGKQAVVDASESPLPIADQGEKSVFSRLGDYLSESGLSTVDQIELLGSMLRMKERQKADEANAALMELTASKPVSAHIGNTESSRVINLPAPSKNKKFGPKRTSNARTF